MKKITMLALLATTLCLAGCKGSNKTTSSSDGPEPLKDDEVEVRLPHSMDESAKDYNIRLRFDDAFFKEDAKNFNKELAMLSLGNTYCAASSLFVEDFYARLKFDGNIKFGNYAVTPTENTIGYSLAHKKIGNSDLIAISVRGFNYGREWADNFYIGETGNHYGFQTKADEIYQGLTSYISENEYSNIKLWITGYSRGGGVSNVLSHKILTSTDLTVAQEDMYVYTFEAPRGLVEENAVAYPNVHNIINNADLVTYMAPAQYGLYRCGVDINIYTAGVNLSRLLKDLDKNLTIPEFVPTGGYSNEQEFIEYLLSELTKEYEDIPENAGKSLHTRKDYVDNYQDDVTYLIGLFFSLKSSTVNKIKERFSAIPTNELPGVILATDGLYNFLKPILDEDSVTYDDTKLHSACNKASALLISNAGVILPLLTNQNNLTHIIDMHMPEVEYVLLKAYQA